MFAFCYDVVLNYKYVFGKNHALIILIRGAVIRYNVIEYMVIRYMFFS